MGTAVLCRLGSNREWRESSRIESPRAHHSRFLTVPSVVVQKTPPRPGASAGDFPANAVWLKVLHGSKAKFRLVRRVACRAARREELADCANEFLEESSDHFGQHPKIAGRTFTGGAERKSGTSGKAGGL